MQQVVCRNNPAVAVRIRAQQGSERIKIQQQQQQQQQSLRSRNDVRQWATARGSQEGATVISSVEQVRASKYQGDVFMLGNFGENNKITAAGDVVVFGRLRGKVHAGCEGDTMSVVAALQLQTRDVRIGDTQLQPNQKIPDGPVILSVNKQGRIEALTYRNGGSGGILNPIVRQRLVTSSLFTGIYATLFGLCLAVWPQTVFGLLFDVSQVATGWIRAGGVILTTFGLQYLGIGFGQSGLDSVRKWGGDAVELFYKSTVVSRAFLAAACLFLVATKQLPLAMLLFVALNAAGAALTWSAMRA
eukprot:TRINITY_DN6875_c0_g2_i13.p2 TRINITY_DN6875_c0_g2~~TRINITY_DN6875_c0_g2_i13.p2  ORF type:complete len:302 (-),score=38.72 TRINITY_DN6875_c0_g2_i13:243-1148(-)